MNINQFLAQTTLPTSQPCAPGWFDFIRSSPLPLLAVGFVVIMLMSSRTKKKQEKGRTDMLKQLKRGDRIQTIGGIFGTVTRAEEDRVEVKVDESSNTKIWFTRSAIHRVVEDSKTETK